MSFFLLLQIKKFLILNGMVYVKYVSANIKSFFLLILGSRLASGSPEHVR